MKWPLSGTPPWVPWAWGAQSPPGRRVGAKAPNNGAWGDAARRLEAARKGEAFSEAEDALESKFVQGGGACKKSGDCPKYGF